MHSQGMPLSLSVTCGVGSKLHSYLFSKRRELDDESELASMCDDALESQKVSFELLRILGASKSAQLSELVVDSVLAFPTSQSANRGGSDSPSKDLMQRREYLRRRMEEREYNMMMFNQPTNPEVDREMEKGNQLSSASNHLSIAMNIVMSVLACFAIAYYIGLQSNQSVTTSMVYGLIASILILVIEMLLYIIRAFSMESKYDDPARVQRAINRRNKAPSYDQAKRMLITREDIARLEELGLDKKNK
jgi:hypothetical protein